MQQRPEKYFQFSFSRRIENMSVCTLSGQHISSLFLKYDFSVDLTCGKPFHALSEDKELVNLKESLQVT